MRPLVLAVLSCAVLAACSPAAPVAETTAAVPDRADASEPSTAAAESPSPLASVAVPTAEPTLEPMATPEPTATPEPGPPVAAADAAGLAEQITAAEATVRDATASPGDIALAGWTAQVAYRQLARNPGWRDEVLGAVPAALRITVQRNADASIELISMITPRTPEQGLPAWRIVEPAPPQELLGYYREAEAEFGVPWYFLAAIHLVETRMGRIRGTSTAGAQGPMQFMPGTWEQYGEGDVNDNRDAIRAAARYLRASGAPGDMAQALFRYNRDNRYVRAITRYAEEMAADERAYQGYHGWQVYYLTTGGDVLLPVGYDGSAG